MSAHPAHPSLRARTAQALGALLDHRSNSEIAALLGIAHTTVARRGADLRAWPSDELLMLAGVDPDLADALRLCVTGEDQEPPQGDAAALVGDLLREIGDSADMQSRIAAALADGKVTAAEATGIIEAINMRRQREDRTLADLRAVARGRK